MESERAASAAQDLPTRDLLRYASFRFAAVMSDARLARQDFVKFIDIYERKHRDVLRKLQLWTFKLPVLEFDWDAADEALDVHIAGNEYVSPGSSRPAAMELAAGSSAETAVVKKGERVVLYSAPASTSGMTAAAVAMGSTGAVTATMSGWILVEGWSVLPLLASGMEGVVMAVSLWASWFAYCTRLRYVTSIVVAQRDSPAGPVLHATVTGRGYVPFSTRSVDTLASELRLEAEYDEEALAAPTRSVVPYARMNPFIRPFVRLRDRGLALYDALWYYLGRRYLTHLWTEEGQSRKFSAWWLDRRGFYNQRLNRKFYFHPTSIAVS
jgi:hypothetical protein